MFIFPTIFYGCWNKINWRQHYSLLSEKAFKKQKTVLQVIRWHNKFIIFVIYILLMFFIPDNHMIQTNCSTGHTRQALCCKMGKEFDHFLNSAKKWVYNQTKYNCSFAKSSYFIFQIQKERRWSFYFCGLWLTLWHSSINLPTNIGHKCCFCY